MELWMLRRWQPYMQADGAGGAGGNEGDPGQHEGDPGARKQERELLSFDDLLAQNKDYQAEFDRRTAKALETARQKAAEETAARIAEAERVATMTAAEKAEHELRQRAEALDARDAEVLKRELTADAKVRLADNGLPVTLADMLDYSSREAWEGSLQVVESAFPGALQAALKKEMAGTPPAAGDPNPSANPNTMTVSEKMKLKVEDPVKYKKLFGG